MSIIALVSALVAIVIMGWVQGFTNGDIFLPWIRQPPSIVAAGLGFLSAMTVFRDAETAHDVALGAAIAGGLLWCTCVARGLGYVMGGHVPIEQEETERSRDP